MRAISTAPPINEPDQASPIIVALPPRQIFIDLEPLTSARPVYGSRLKDKNRCGLGRITCYCEIVCMCVHIYTRITYIYILYTGEYLAGRLR